MTLSEKKECSFVESLKNLTINEGVTLVVGISTTVATFLNCCYVARQTDINQAQANYEKQENQPIFHFEVVQMLDPAESFYKTDYLYLYNKGATPRSPYDIKVSSFFRLTYSKQGEYSAIRIEIPDYFAISSNGGDEKNVIYKAYTIGNNSIYHKIYQSSIFDTERGEGFYSIEKERLVKISYTDVYNEPHILYYNDQVEISKNDYDSFWSKEGSIKYVGIRRLNEIRYTDMKKQLLKSMD